MLSRNQPEAILSYAVLASCLLAFCSAVGLSEGKNIFSRPNESWLITWLPLAFAIAAATKPLTRGGRSNRPRVDG